MVGITFWNQTAKIFSEGSPVTPVLAGYRVSALSNNGSTGMLGDREAEGS